MSAKFTINCTAWREMRRNTLRGFAKIKIEELRLVVNEIAIHESNGRPWAALPARPWVKDGAVITDDSGKIKYAPLFEFDNAVVRSAFSDAVIAAVRRFDTHALENGDLR
jgi:hypothetical protein